MKMYGWRLQKRYGNLESVQGRREVTEIFQNAKWITYVRSHPCYGHGDLCIVAVVSERGTWLWCGSHACGNGVFSDLLSPCQASSCRVHRHEAGCCTLSVVPRIVTYCVAFDGCIVMNYTNVSYCTRPLGQWTCPSTRASLTAGVSHDLWRGSHRRGKEMLIPPAWLIWRFLTPTVRQMSLSAV
jgi:hypothetical protein